MYHIYFRVDSGYIIGIGHIMRCLNLCEYILSYQKCIITFICKNHMGNISNKINYNLLLLDIEYDIDTNIESWLGGEIEKECDQIIDKIDKNEKDNILIIDHYSIDEKWENRMKKYFKKIIVIDDLFNRKHMCDMLIDQNTYLRNPYNNLVPINCQIYCGMEYILLNKNFKLNNLIENKNRINISFGGSDNMNYTLKIIKYIIKNQMNINKFNQYIFDIIVGPSYKYCDELNNFINKFNNVNLFIDIDSYKINQLLDETILCVTSAGISIYERLYKKQKCLVIQLADNQKNVINTLKRMKMIYHIKNKYEIIDKINNIDELKIKYYENISSKVNDIIISIFE